MKVLVTGGHGLVGKSLQKIIENSNIVANHPSLKFWFLSRKECDLRNKTDVYTTFSLHKPDIVIHLASHVGGVYDNLNNNYKYLIDNIAINTNIVDACSEFNVKKLINMLSTCIFPDKGVLYPLTSEQLHNGLPHKSNIGYAYSKRLLHVASDILSSSKNIQVVNLIPTNLYGENDNYNIEAAHVIPALIHKMYLSQKNNLPFYVKGSGSAIRQFLYADDLSRVILGFVMMEIKENITCIVSPPESSEITISKLVSKLVTIYDYKGEVIYDTNVEDGQFKKTTTDDELRNWFPDFEFTSLDVGLNKTISYVKENYESIRK